MSSSHPVIPTAPAAAEESPSRRLSKRAGDLLDTRIASFRSKRFHDAPALGAWAFRDCFITLEQLPANKGEAARYRVVLSAETRANLAAALRGAVFESMVSSAEEKMAAWFSKNAPAELLKRLGIGLPNLAPGRQDAIDAIVGYREAKSANLAADALEDAKLFAADGNAESKRVRDIELRRLEDDLAQAEKYLKILREDWPKREARREKLNAFSSGRILLELPECHHVAQEWAERFAPGSPTCAGLFEFLKNSGDGPVSDERRLSEAVASDLAAFDAIQVSLPVEVPRTPTVFVQKVPDTPVAVRPAVGRRKALVGGLIAAVLATGVGVCAVAKKSVREDDAFGTEGRVAETLPPARAEPEFRPKPEDPLQPAALPPPSWNDRPAAPRHVEAQKLAGPGSLTLAELPDWIAFQGFFEEAISQAVLTVPAGMTGESAFDAVVVAYVGEKEKILNRNGVSPSSVSDAISTAYQTVSDGAHKTRNVVFIAHTSHGAALVAIRGCGDLKRVLPSEDLLPALDAVDAKVLDEKLEAAFRLNISGLRKFSAALRYGELTKAISRTLGGRMSERGPDFAHLYWEGVPSWGSGKPGSEGVTVSFRPIFSTVAPYSFTDYDAFQPYEAASFFAGKAREDILAALAAEKPADHAAARIIALRILASNREIEVAKDELVNNALEITVEHTPWTPAEEKKSPWEVRIPKPRFPGASVDSVERSFGHQEKSYATISLDLSGIR